MTRGRPRHVLLRFGLLGMCLATGIALSGCGSSVATTSPRLTSSAAVTTEPAATAAPSPSDRGSGATQTDTAWGRIWDSLPTGFPTVPGAKPATEAAQGPASATLDVEGGSAETIASSMRSALEGAGFQTEGLSGPLEDGTYVLDMTGEPAGCMAQIRASPLGGTTIVTILYGALCPND